MLARAKSVPSASGKAWHLYNGDCVDVARSLPDSSLDYCIFSPPFESLYTYSDSPLDMSNCRDSETFWTHFSFLIKELYRIILPGRLITIHCCQLPRTIATHGYIGLKDFRGEIIRNFEAAGFVYHSEVCIRKDPVAMMQRSKSIGLLHKQLKKDSSLSRQAGADYMVSLVKVGHLVTMRHRGENPRPILGRLSYYQGDISDEEFETRHMGRVRGNSRSRVEHKSIEIWQRYAEPIWIDIAQSDILSTKMARDIPDERHIAPLQLTAIRRCVQLWSNKGETVFSPFAGIGSELYSAVELGRRGLGVELKPSYYQQAVANLRTIESARQRELIDRA
jgi:DNA modification methylase